MPSRSQRGPRTVLSAGLLLVCGLVAWWASGETAASPDVAVHARIEHLVAAEDGGFWAFLDSGRENRVLHLVRFDAAGAPQEESSLHVDEGQFSPIAAAIDGAGRVWTAVSLPSAPRDPLGDPRNRSWRLSVFAADGTQLAAHDTHGSLLGLTGDGAAWVLRQGSGDEEPEVLRVDPFAAGETRVLSLERSVWGPSDQYDVTYGRALRPAADGAFYFIDVDSATTLLRRYEPPGVAAGEQRIRSSTGGLFLADNRGDDLFLADRDGVVRYRPNTPLQRWVVVGQIRDIAASDDGAWVLTEGPRILHLLADGSIAPPLDLDTPPPGMTYAERRELLASSAVAARPGHEPGPEHWLEVMMADGGDRGLAARRQLVDLGADAVDAVLATGDRTLWPQPLKRLLADLLAADPDAVGDRLVDHLEQAAAAGDGRASFLDDVLLGAWPQPSPRFLALLDEQLSSRGPLAGLARTAYDGGHDGWEGGPTLPPPGERFPAPPWLIERYLDHRAGEPDPRLGDRDRFLLTQFHRAADGIEAHLLDVDDPARAGLLDTLARFPSALAIYAPGHFGAAEEVLARRAHAWQASDQLAVAELGTLLSVASGDASAVPRLLATPIDRTREYSASEALVALLHRHPATSEPELAAGLVRPLLERPSPFATDPLSTLLGDAPPAVLGAAARALAGDDVPCANRAAAEGLLLAEGTWGAVPAPDLAALVETGPPAPCTDTGYRFLDAAWRRFSDRPMLRRRIEDRVRSTVAATPARPRHGRPPAWLALFADPQEHGLSRLVPEAKLAELVAEPPPEGWNEARWVHGVSTAAAARGPWPGFRTWLEAELERRPDLVGVLPRAAAERWLGARLDDMVLDDMVLDAETRESRGRRGETADEEAAPSRCRDDGRAPGG